MTMKPPLWSTLHDSAETLTRRGETPFTRLALLTQARLNLPELQRASFDPTVQSMTVKAHGGPTSLGAGLFRRVDKGLYVLAAATPTFVTAARSLPTQPNSSRLPEFRSTASLDLRVEELVKSFGRYLDVYDRELPFKRTGQLELHLRTIALRRRMGSAAAACENADFRAELRATLGAWGIGRRSSRLVDELTFDRALKSAEFRGLEGLSLRDVQEPKEFATHLWRLIDRLGVVTNQAKVVAGTKTLHHLFPDLVVPIDRAWTGAFFGWPASYFKSQQEEIVWSANEAFLEVARQVTLAHFLGPGWRSSESKLIDNAIVGYCKANGIVPGGRHVCLPRSD